jgi:hypothetical protein
VWVTGRGEVWFDGENQDRIDILPEKKNYQPGETANFQVRMPFRYATALVAVEREGVIDTRVVQLSGQDPTISVPMKAEYGPNVYVSVLAVRGRMREVPWYSFFIWGWKEPINWWHEFRSTRVRAPSSISPNRPGNSASPKSTSVMRAIACKWPSAPTSRLIPSVPRPRCRCR